MRKNTWKYRIKPYSMAEEEAPMDERSRCRMHMYID